MKSLLIIFMLLTATMVTPAQFKSTELVDAIEKDMRTIWKDRGTVYRNGNRIAVILSDGHVDEFEITDKGQRTLHYGLLPFEGKGEHCYKIAPCDGKL